MYHQTDRECATQALGFDHLDQSTIEWTYQFWVYIRTQFVATPSFNDGIPILFYGWSTTHLMVALAALVRRTHSNVWVTRARRWHARPNFWWSCLLHLLCACYGGGYASNKNGYITHHDGCASHFERHTTPGWHTPHTVIHPPGLPTTTFGRHTIHLGWHTTIPGRHTSPPGWYTTP